MSTDLDIAVIGGGVIGLAIARALVARRQSVTVIERHGAPGTETSARNSEVIHAGLYYEPGSLKARLCVEGRRMLYRFAAENGVSAERTGKLLVATSPAEIASLEAIAATARANGVDDLVALTATEAAALEPEVSCVAAYLSPSTGIIDSHRLMQALEGHITSGAGEIALNSDVSGLAHGPNGTFRLAISAAGGQTAVTARRLVIASGLAASRHGTMLVYRPGYAVPATILAKAHYFTLTGRNPFRHLVYPMPEQGGLGVHVTLDTAGGAKFGPDISWEHSGDYAFEDADGRRRARFEMAIRRYWPGLPDGALEPGYTGMRPKLSRPGAPVADFAIHGPEAHGVPGLVALYGIESPGLTSSLAIGEIVAKLLCGSSAQPRA